MANTFPTISGSIADALNVSDAEISNLTNAAPFVAALPAEESSDGTTHKYSRETGAPTVGFRAENAGRYFSTDTDELVTISLKILDWSHMADKAVADAWRKGGKEAYIARRGLRHLRAALSKYEKQLIYGHTTAGDSDGFKGMADVLNDTADSMVVDATGSSSNAGTSVWAVRMGPDDFSGVYNGDGIVSIDETIVQNFVDGSGKNLPVYYTPACTWLAAQIASIYAFGRICNLTTQSGKGLTDNLVSQLIERFPADRRPNVLVMNMQSLGQLQRSRTATNATGAEAPYPTEVHGVPIIVTESIVKTEAILTATPVSET